MPDIANQVVISRDGNRAVLLRTCEGPHRDIQRQGEMFAFNTLLPNEMRGPRLVVVLTDNATQLYESADLRLPGPSAEAPDLIVLAEATIGEWLDSLDSPPALDVDPIHLICSSHYMEEWKTRERCDDDALLEYAAWKAFWAWRLEAANLALKGAECVRLGVRLPTLARLLELEDGVSWVIGARTPSSISYRPLPPLLKAQREKRVRGGLVLGADPLQVILASPRYVAVRAHLDKARRFLTSDPPDLPNSAKEGICAVEALTRLACNSPKETLGELLKTLKTSNRADPALIKALEGLWGYTSNEPGVRHGGTAALDYDQARLVLSLAEASVSYLLRLDTGP